MTPTSSPTERKEETEVTEMPIGGGPAYKYTEFMGYPLPDVPPREDVTFDGWGRYKLPSPTTGRLTSYTRATTLGYALADDAFLTSWKIREKVAAVLAAQGYAANVNDSLSDNQMAMAVEYNNLVRVMANGSKVTDINKIIDLIHDFSGGADARELGSAVHDWLGELDMGRVLVHQIPEQFQPYVRSYQDALAEAGLVAVPEYTERVVLNDRGKEHIAGRIDRIYRRVASGDLVLGDLKTSKSIDLGVVSFGVQFAVYGYATKMLALDGASWEPMPEIDQTQCLVVHLPSDKPEQAEVVPFDLWVAGDAMIQAIEVREQRKEIKKKILAAEHPAPAASTVRYVEARHALLNIKAPEDASRVFEQYEEVWNDDLTQLGAACLELLATTEQEK